MLGIDLGKNSCSLVGFDPAGTVVLRRRARRDTIVGLTAKLPACVVAMEACCGAHHLGRLLAAQGHTIRLMSPEYVKAKKNDDRDAEAIAEAATRPTMRFVPLKAPDQLDMQSLHRVRSRLVSMRTMLMNQLRAILLERGLVFPQGRRKFETAVGILVTDPQAQIGARIQALDREFVAHARADEAARRLVSISGVGPMTATALRAAVDDGSAFASARDLPAWLGLVPRQHTTGGKPKLLGISKRGNAYLRGLFIHGARAALASLSKVEDATGRWLRSLLECTPVGPKIAV